MLEKDPWSDILHNDHTLHSIKLSEAVGYGYSLVGYVTFNKNPIRESIPKYIHFLQFGAGLQVSHIIYSDPANVEFYCLRLQC